MAQYGKPISKHPYMAVYALDPNPQKETALQYASQQMGLTYHIFSDVAHSESDIENSWDLDTDITATNEDWLRSIMECDFFITDSFHGVCFAIIFHKPFICIANPYRGLSRFTSLLGQLGLMDRMVSGSAEIMQRPELFEPVDYTRVDFILKKIIEKSHKWLEQAFAAPICKPISFYNLLDDRLDEMEPRLKQAEEKVYATESWLSNTHQRLDRIEPILGRIDALEQIYRRVDALEKGLLNEQIRSNAIDLNLVHVEKRVNGLKQLLDEIKTRPLLDALKDHIRKK
jgi:hypothetical protein